eukprot:5759285-Pleurochrysis_carterae.AAC.2
MATCSTEAPGWWTGASKKMPACGCCLRSAPAVCSPDDFREYLTLWISTSVAFTPPHRSPQPAAAQGSSSQCCAFPCAVIHTLLLGVGALRGAEGLRASVEVEPDNGGEGAAVAATAVAAAIAAVAAAAAHGLRSHRASLNAAQRISQSGVSWQTFLDCAFHSPQSSRFHRVSASGTSYACGLRVSLIRCSIHSF